MSPINAYFDRYERRKSAGVVQNGVLLLFICAMPGANAGARAAGGTDRPTAAALAAAAEPPTLPRRLVTGRDLHRFPYSKLAAQRVTRSDHR